MYFTNLCWWQKWCVVQKVLPVKIVMYSTRTILEKPVEITRIDFLVFSSNLFILLASCQIFASCSCRKNNLQNISLASSVYTLNWLQLNDLSGNLGKLKKEATNTFLLSTYSHMEHTIWNACYIEFFWGIKLPTKNK